MFNNGVSLSDIAAVTGRNNDGFFGNDGWWILIILFAIFGWGGRGNGGYGGITGGAMDGYILTSDFASIERKLDSVNNGICSLGYDQLAQMNGINQNVSNIGNANLNAIYQGNATMQAQLADCCCQNREAIAQVRFDMATDACAIQNTLQGNTRDIIDNQNANARQIIDAINAQTIAAKDEKIAEMAEKIQALNLAASQQAQNNYIISQLRMPNPIPAFQVPNPYATYGYGNCGCA